MNIQTPAPDQKTDHDAASLPVRVPLVTEPLGLFGSLAASRRNVLAIIPDIAVRQPMVSGRTGMATEFGDLVGDRCCVSGSVDR